MGYFKQQLIEEEEMDYRVPDEIDIEYFIHQECENIARKNFKLKFSELNEHDKKEVTLVAEQRVLGI
tara:strand:- start:7731 stop:7931 length:201 start_codon:yes stop_codon:yes gene_type:complete